MLWLRSAADADLDVPEHRHTFHGALARGLARPLRFRSQMTKRHLTTRPEWEDALRSGRKTIDARLVADDIADLRVGRVVRYPGARVRVRGMRFYHSFGDLLAQEDWHRIAPDAASRDDVLRLLEEGRRETERETGAVALELEPETSPGREP